MSATHPQATVVRDGTVLPGGGAAAVRADVLIEDGVVAAIEPGYSGRADVELDAGGCLVVPGLVNAHVHPSATPMLRGIAEDLDLADGAAFYHSTTPVRKIGFELLAEDEFADLLLWDTAAMLLGGATTVVNENFGSADAWIELVGRLGFRSSTGITYPANVGAIGYVEDGKVVKDEAEDIGAAFTAALELHDRCDGDFDGRLRIHLSPHASETVPEEILRETRREADARGTSIHLHLAQHPDEVETIQRRHGMSPVAYAESIGLLGDDVLATHVTYSDAADWDILARTGTTLVHCPYRKAKEGLTSPMEELLARDGRVALASDSFSHRLVEEMRLGALLGKVRAGVVGRPTAPQLFAAATAGVAAVLGEGYGTIAVGGPGDVCVVAIDSPFASPVLDPIRTLVYYADGDAVRHTTVAGRPVVRDGAIPGVDLARLRGRVDAAAQRIWAKAGEEGALPSHDCCGGAR